jgi:hypothetical protein
LLEVEEAGAGEQLGQHDASLEPGKRRADTVVEPV